MQTIEITKIGSTRSSYIVFFDGTQCHDQVKSSSSPTTQSSYNCFSGGSERGGKMFLHQSRKGIRNRGRKVKTLRNHRGN